MSGNETEKEKTNIEIDNNDQEEIEVDHKDRDEEASVESTENKKVDEFLVELTEDEDPKQWTHKKKWLVTFVVSLVTFISPATSSIVAPADTKIVEEFGITSTVISQMSISIFLLGYAVAPLILAPLSEQFGRKPVIILTNMFFLAFNLGCGWSQNTAQLIAFRFLAGVGGSVPQSVGSGTLADMWSSEERGKAYSVYSLAPLLGPALGPIAGGFIAMNTTWRWAFWATSAVDAVIAAILFFTYHETYGPRLLRQKAVKARKETGDPRYYSKFDDTGSGKSITTIFIINLVRPLRFLFTEPIIMFVAIYMAFLYGTFYLLLTTFPTLWTQSYNMSEGIGGLHYISVTIGCTVAAQVGSRLLDVIYRNLKKKNNDIGQPEFRVPLMFISSLLFPAGMFLYGWSGEKLFHWIVPDIGMAIASFGIVIAFTPLQIYVVDSYGRYAASAMAAVTMLRSLCGFALPLAGPRMYDQLGFGWGNSTLGFIALAFGITLPLIMWYKGAGIRRSSKWAVHV